MDPSSASSREHDVSLGTIRSWWKVPAISHFCSLFRTTFKLPDFEIEELEEALYQDSEVNTSRFLIDLLTALLKGSFETEDIDDGNYSDYLRDICNIHWEKENRVNPLNNEDTSFQSLSTLMKVEILYTLCDYRLDADDVSILKDYDGETLRVEPLGVDSKGTTYWYFYGTRLYREEVPPPRPPKKKQKKRKKKKKRCFLQALRKNLAFSQSWISEDDEPVPEPPPKKRKGRTGKALERKGTKGKDKMTSPTGRRKKRNNNAVESDSDDEDDDVPLAKMASPPRKKSKGAPAVNKKRGKQDEDEKVASKRGGGRKAGVTKDGKRQTNKEEKIDRRKKSARGKKMTKREIARLEAEAAKQKKAEGKGQKGKMRGRGNHSETDESMSLADMKRSNVSGKKGTNAKRKNSGKGAPARGRGNRQEDSSDEDDEAERPPVKKKRPPAPHALLLPSWSNDEESSSSSESSSSEEEPEPAKWQVICQTEEDWQTLTDSFKKSKSKCEKELYQVLSENFLPAIHTLFTAKERELRRKLQDLAPKRTSSRIAVRKSKQEEEEKVRALMEYEEEQRQKAEEASRREYELTERRKKVQAEERRKAAEEMKEKEDRKKLRSLRRHERLVERRNPSAKQKKRSLYEGFKKVLEAVKNHPDAWPFVDPVQESFAPAYYDIIKSPMDISTVEVKVQEEMYRSKAKFEADVELIFSNCMEYNGPESEYTMMGANVASCFQESLDQHFPPGSISDGELSDIASDQDSAYCLSYPRELRRRSKALNYTEMESTSDSGDTGRDEDDEERAEERTEEGRKVFPSYLAEKGRSETTNKENSSINLESNDCNSKSSIQNHKIAKNGIMKGETKDLPSLRDKAENGKILAASFQRNSENSSPPQNRDSSSVTPASTSEMTVVKSKQEQKVASLPKKVSPKRPKTSKVANEGKSVKVKEKVAKESHTGTKSDGVLEKTFSSDNCSSNSELTSLQRLEAITDRLGKSLDTRKDLSIKSTHSVSKEIEDSAQAKGSALKLSPVAKVKEDLSLSDSNVKPFSKDLKSVPISSSTRVDEPPVKIKSEAATCGSCSHTRNQPPKNSLPEVASPLVVPSNLSTVYNPINPSDPLSAASKSSSSVSPPFVRSSSPVKTAAGFHLSGASSTALNTYFAQVTTRQGTVNSPKVGEGDAPRSLPGFRPGKSNHFSAFHSVGKDHGQSRPRIESSVDAKQSPFSGQLMQTSPQVGALSHHGNKGLPYSTFGSTGKTNFTAQQATTSTLNDSSSPFQSPKTYPNQPTTIVRPVSRYPAQAQAIRQNQYLLQSGAISNPTPSMGPQLNILQIASAPSLTLNIQPNGLLNNQPVVNVATSRQTVGTGMYGQGMNSVGNHMVQNNLQQKPTLVVQYQGAAGETPPYNAQFRAGYQ